MAAEDDASWFEAERALYEAHYLAGSNPRQQSGFGRDERDWERLRRPVVAPIDRDGTFLDVGCANGLLMESVTRWAEQAGYCVEAYGLDISEKLVALAKRRLPMWRDRISAGNALCWDPPRRFDFVRTELVYVPSHRRHSYVERLLERFLSERGKLILCSYGSTRPEGARAEPLLDALAEWGIEVEGCEDVVSEQHGFVITRVVWVSKGT